MMVAKKIISWKKWRNPYNPANHKKSEDMFDDGYDSDLVEYDEDNDVSSPDNPSLVFFTPLGPIPLNEHNDPEKLFNFWVGHTNFDITPKIKSIINTTEGVEILNIYTRYRMRIGIGHMFLPSQVMNNINKAISQYFNDDTTKQQESNPGPSTRQGFEYSDQRNIPE